NVLHAASGGVRLAAQRLEHDPARARRLLDSALAAMDHGAMVTRRLLTVAGRAVLFPEPLDIAAMFAEVREGLARGSGIIEVRIDMPDGVALALADRAQLGAALRGLAENARDAMPQGGSLMLAASAEAVPEGDPHPADLRPGAYLRLDVVDRGAGMDAATLARAPEPFFTTKASGTGLGLAAARAFARQSGGALMIASEAGRGTAVSLWLPQAEVREVTSSQDQSLMAASPRGRVLLVDDDPLVLRVLRAQLEEAGHAVTAVGSGVAALAALNDDGAVDLLVTDLSMPGMDGRELIRAAQARRPGLPAVLLTGYP
ncbi:response regulator, partial [Paracraurococcus lichenis]